MQIIVGQTAGFCFGVANAVNKTEIEIENNNKMYCLGELVHNSQVIEDLSQKGLQIIRDLRDIDNNGKVIICAHGIPLETYNLAKRMNIELIDLTCPKILKIHKIAEEYSNKGYYIFLIGKVNHPESIGTISYCGNKCNIIEDVDDIEESLCEFRKSNINKLAVICQTTISIKKFEQVIEILESKVDNNIELKIINTICEATKERQKETEKIAKQVQIMIIIGGKNSSNSTKLYDIAKQYCPDSIHIETKSELDIEHVRNFQRVGIMAGASTPKKSIEQVVEILKQV